MSPISAGERPRHGSRTKRRPTALALFGEGALITGFRPSPAAVAPEEALEENLWSDEKENPKIPSLGLKKKTKNDGGGSTTQKEELSN